jgi:RecA/RadA recombinase
MMAKVKRDASEEMYSPVNLGEILGELEKAVKIQSITIGEENRISTGLLCVDLTLGGGITAGMYTVAGPEQSAKTTLTISIMAASVKQNVGARVLWDAENSSGSSMDYVENIFKAQDVNEDIQTLFGVKEKGKYKVKPVVYYRDEGEMDTFYNWLSGFLRRLPDKRFEAERWWYVYPTTPENKSKYKGHYDVRMSSAMGALYIPAEDGALQAMVMVDSYPSLLPASMDEDDPRAGMALQAREFSRHIPRVKGKLRAKRVALLGINQLREAPAVMFKDPNYEPGGQALRFNSDVRLRSVPRALSGVPFNPKGKGQIEKEPSVSGEGEDTYRYVNLKAIKNKLSVPNREVWLRIWVQDENSVAKGFCPVWDTFYALHLTGQVSGKRSSMLLNIHGLGKARKNIDWAEFKTMVLGDKEAITAVCKKLGYKPFNLRKGLFSMMRKGVMEKLYSETHSKNIQNLKVKKKDLDDDVEEDDDE